MAASAVASAPGRLPYLDGWRGVSLLCVLAGHFLFVPGLGPFGVELFFVLSGRLMGEILFEKRFPLPKFFQRRVSRIYPALLFFVAISFGLFQESQDHPVNAWAVLRALTFTYNYGGATNHMLDHIWSLCVEEHAYLILGLVAYLARRGKLSVLPTLWTLTALSMADGLFSSLVLHQDWFHAYWRTDAHLGTITGSAALYLHTRKLKPHLALAFVTPALLLTAAALMRAPDWLQYSAGSLMLAGAVAMLDHAPLALKRLLSLKAITAVGIGSFSIYLWQQPFYQFSFGQSRLGALALCGLAVGAGYLSFTLVEDPLRKLLNGGVKPFGRTPVGSPRSAGPSLPRPG